MNKKIRMITITAAVFFIAFAIIATDITMTYLTSLSGQKNNELFQGKLTAIIYENGSPAPDGIKNITPSGLNAAKLVQVKNISDPREVDAYIRVMLVPVFRTSGGSLGGNITLNPAGNTTIISGPNGGTVTLNLTAGWDSNWIYNNGYFYCKTIIHPDALTPVLLESVTVSDSTLWNTFQLEVLSDAIQSEGGAAKAVWGSIADQLEQP